MNKGKLTLNRIRRITAKLEIAKGEGGWANVPGDFQSVEIARCICAVMSANDHMMIILPAQGATFLCL